MLPFLKTSPFPKLSINFLYLSSWCFSTSPIPLKVSAISLNPSSSATLAKSVTEVGEEYTYELSSDNATLLDSNVWEYTFKDLPKYDNQGRKIIYTLREELDSKFYIEEDRPAATESNEHYTIVNTFKVPDEKTSVTVRKMWDDNGDKAEKRPEEVTLIINGLRRRYKYY